MDGPRRWRQRRVSVTSPLFFWQAAIVCPEGMLLPRGAALSWFQLFLLCGWVQMFQFFAPNLQVHDVLGWCRTELPSDSKPALLWFPPVWECWQTEFFQGKRANFKNIIVIFHALSLAKKTRVSLCPATFSPFQLEKLEKCQTMHSWVQKLNTRRKKIWYSPNKFQDWGKSPRFFQVFQDFYPGSVPKYQAEPMLQTWNLSQILFCFLFVMETIRRNAVPVPDMQGSNFGGHRRTWLPLFSGDGRCRSQVSPIALGPRGNHTWCGFSFLFTQSKNNRTRVCKDSLKEQTSTKGNNSDGLLFDLLNVSNKTKNVNQDRAKKRHTQSNRTRTKQKLEPTSKHYMISTRAERHYIPVVVRENSTKTPLCLHCLFSQVSFKSGKERENNRIHCGPPEMMARTWPRNHWNQEIPANRFLMSLTPESTFLKIKDHCQIYIYKKLSCVSRCLAVCFGFSVAIFCGDHMFSPKMSSVCGVFLSFHFADPCWRSPKIGVCHVSPTKPGSKNYSQ